MCVTTMSARPGMASPVSNGCVSVVLGVSVAAFVLEDITVGVGGVVGVVRVWRASLCVVSSLKSVLFTFLS